MQIMIINVRAYNPVCSRAINSVCQIAGCAGFCGWLLLVSSRSSFLSVTQNLLPKRRCGYGVDEPWEYEQSTKKLNHNVTPVSSGCPAFLCCNSSQSLGWLHQEQYSFATVAGTCGSLSWSLESPLTLFEAYTESWPSSSSELQCYQKAHSWLIMPSPQVQLQIEFHGYHFLHIYDLLESVSLLFVHEGVSEYRELCLPNHRHLLRPRAVPGMEYLVSQALSSDWTLVMFQTGPLVSSLELCVGWWQ